MGLLPLVAQACNIGIEAVSRQDVPALRRERLAWISQNFIRPETIAAASALIVSAHAALPLVKIWGAGDVASADGMRFTAPASAIHAGPNPKYFGQSRGVTWYNLMSNQFSGLNGIVVPAPCATAWCCWHCSSNRKPSWSLPNS